jgi:hypothetical protein
MHTPFGKIPETLVISPKRPKRPGWKEWGRQFSLGTAGYRDQLDPPILFHGSAVFSAHHGYRGGCPARRGHCARLAASAHWGRGASAYAKIHRLFARIYAASGITVHLQAGTSRTTPIWLSSFGVFHYGLDGGENFTASHSQSFKGGWKPMDTTACNCSRC